jgi:hypothetical protein
MKGLFYVGIEPADFVNRFLNIASYEQCLTETAIALAFDDHKKDFLKEMGTAVKAHDEDMIMDVMVCLNIPDECLDPSDRFATGEI